MPFFVRAGLKFETQNLDVLKKIHTHQRTRDLHLHVFCAEERLSVGKIPKKTTQAKEKNNGHRTRKWEQHFRMRPSASRNMQGPPSSHQYPRGKKKSLGVGLPIWRSFSWGLVSKSLFKEPLQRPAEQGVLFIFSCKSRGWWLSSGT